MVRQEQYPFSAFLSTEEVDAFYPKTFSDRIDKILLAISKRTAYVGEVVDYSVNEMTSLLLLIDMTRKVNYWINKN